MQQGGEEGQGGTRAIQILQKAKSVSPTRINVQMSSASNNFIRPLFYSIKNLSFHFFICVLISLLLF